MYKLKDMITNPTTELTEETKETLNLLYELAEGKAESFETKITNNLRTARNLTVPITVILKSHQEIRVITSDTTDNDITEAIQETLNHIISGGTDNIINGITRLIHTDLHTVLDDTKGKERTETRYYIATEGLSIVRLDFMYWSRHINATNTDNYVKKCLMYTVVKSSVDLSKLSFNAFLSEYQKQLSKCSFNIDELKQEIQHIQEIYKLFNPF